jgi:hypothetical protein
LNYQLKAEDIDDLVNSKPQCIERIMLVIKRKIEDYKRNPPPVEKRTVQHPPPQNGYAYMHSPPLNNQSPISGYTNNYTNIVSPIETPTIMHHQFMAQGRGGVPPNYPMPIETPVSNHQRRKSPTMQRNGMNLVTNPQPNQYPGVNPNVQQQGKHDHRELSELR